MKTLIIILIITIISLPVFSQSFYHKKMKKVASKVNNVSCEAQKPRFTFVQNLNQKVMYKKKRNQIKRRK